MGRRSARAERATGEVADACRLAEPVLPRLPLAPGTLAPRVLTSMLPAAG